MGTSLESRPWWLKKGPSCMMALSTGKLLQAASKVPWFHQSSLSFLCTYHSFNRGQMFESKIVLTCKLWSSAGKCDWGIHMLDWSLLSLAKSFPCFLMSMKAFSRACIVASTLPSCAFLYLWDLKSWLSLETSSRESGIIGPDLKTKLKGLPPLQPLRTLCLLHLNYILRQGGE